MDELLLMNCYIRNKLCLNQWTNFLLSPFLPLLLAFFLPFSCLFFGMFGIELTVTNQFNTILQGDFNVGEWGGELRGSRLEA